MDFFLSLLYIASAALTILGAVSFWKKAQQNTQRMHEAVASANPGPPTYGQVQTAVTITVEDLQSGEEDTRADLWLVCGGVAFGALASIVSLFI